ncbi:hypothetical protein C8R45DRAFT_1093978 [Mycena sanguinolenta]|nr:hypothetical protein C8R45DRAFT_1093978 [Mycena sanguinolenta]
MEAKGLSGRVLRLPRRRRRKETSSTALLTWDVVRTSLELVNNSADDWLPLKSVVGAVVALCDLVDRVTACDESAETLTWRAVAILDTIYHAVDANDTITPHFLDGILQFEKLINEIRTKMEAITKKNRVLRVLHRKSSQCNHFGHSCLSCAQTHNLDTKHDLSDVTRIEDKVESVPSTLEHSNLLLHAHVKFLQLAIERILWEPETKTLQNNHVVAFLSLQVSVVLHKSENGDEEYNPGWAWPGGGRPNRLSLD